MWRGLAATALAGSQLAGWRLSSGSGPSLANVATSAWRGAASAFSQLANGVFHSVLFSQFVAIYSMTISMTGYCQ